ncbi:hypothetical protein GCM10022408_17300 [Hymenobacter fastidiosus]|uniref:Uncharacterized protein n=1 Tax=Hymenobacter fastidiosus TaxID=486264 RepID=A0ABP7S367_9BACT
MRINVQPFASPASAPGVDLPATGVEVTGAKVAAGATEPAAGTVVWAQAFSREKADMRTEHSRSRSPRPGSPRPEF